MLPNIAIILPPKEHHSRHQKGAVALCMADFTRHSRYRDNTTFLGHTEADFGELNHYQVRDWQRWYWRDSRAYAHACAKWIRQHNITHVEVQNRPIIFQYLARVLPDHIVLTLHLHNDIQEMRWFGSARARQRLLNRASAVYCVSEYIRKRLLDGVKHHREKAVVIHNGIDTEHFLPQPKTRTILYVGRIIREKGALPLASALTKIAAQLPDWNFIFCGVDRRNVVSDYERATHHLLGQLGTQFHYTGYLDHSEVMQQFSRAEIALIPSVWQEPFGRTALEAMCAGSAVITSGSGGLTEIVSGAEAGTGIDAGVDTGLIVPALADMDAFSDALAAAILALARDDVRRASIQHLGRDRAVHAFDIRKQSRLLDDWRDRLQHND